MGCKTYFLVVSFCKQINQIGRKTGAESLAEGAAVSLLRLDEVLVHFTYGPLEGSSVDS
jgi:hypothetical protein